MEKENNTNMVIDDKNFDVYKAIEEFLDCAKRTILPFNQLAYETMLGVLELTLVRDATSNAILGNSIIRTNSTEQGCPEPPQSDLDEQVLSIINQVRNVIDKNESGE